MVAGNDINKILDGPISTERAVREIEANNTLIYKRIAFHHSSLIIICENFRPVVSCRYD